MPEETRTEKKTVQVFIWRSRARGFLAVTAHDLEEARTIAVGQQPNLQNFVTREPEAVISTKVGEVIYLRQRV